MALLFKELIESGLVHEDVETICGRGLTRYTQRPVMEDGKLIWIDGATSSGDAEIIATVEKPFSSHGGLQVMKGNLGISVLKTSSLREGSFVIKAPAVVFEDQHELDAALSMPEN